MARFWSAEDGGPRRQQIVDGVGLGAREAQLSVTTRIAPATTMVVGRGDDLYLLRHTAGDGAVAIVERIDPLTLEPLAASGELPGGPVWPGGLAVADDGDVHVVFGNHAHRLAGDDLRVLAARRLPRDRPYNSFVTLPDGHLVTKDFAGSRPGFPVAEHEREPTELLVLDPHSLDVVAALAMAEPSIARLSALGDTVYVVGDTSLLRAHWSGGALVADTGFVAPYRTEPGQTYGWDCVLIGGCAWFLDNGEGSEHFTGSLRGHGVATAPLHLVAVDLTTGKVRRAEVCGQPGGLVANPPVVDPSRRIALAYDSGNGVVTAFDTDALSVRWTRPQDHGSHLLLYPATGEVVTGDGADVVVLDIVTGDELARVDSGLGMQSVLFPCPGRGRSFYVTTFMGLSRIEVTD